MKLSSHALHFSPAHHFRGIVVLVDGLHGTPAYVTLTLVKKIETMIPIRYVPMEKMKMFDVLGVPCPWVL